MTDVQARTKRSLFLNYLSEEVQLRALFSRLFDACTSSRCLRHALLLVALPALHGCVSDLAALPDSTFGANVNNSKFSSPLDSTTLDSMPANSTLANSTIQTERSSLSANRLPANEDKSYEFSSDELISNPPIFNKLSEIRQLANSSLAGTGSNLLKSASDDLHKTAASLPGKEHEIQPDERYTLEAVSASLPALLFALASDAQLQLDIHGSVESVVTIKHKDQSLDVILDALSEQAGFMWQRSDDLLQIWGGQAYSYTYPVNYLNISRRTQSSVGLATQVGTINATDATGGGIANSSQTLVENHSDHTFWDSLSVDIAGLLKQQHGEQTQAEYSINKEAGLITLYAIPDIHRRMQHYMDLLHENTQRQVLIEASVVEVALSDTFSAGVDWQVLANGVNGINAAQVLVGATEVAVDTVNRIAAPAGLVSLVQQGSRADVTATLSLLEQFGDVRILSRPRIIALNNQSAVLKVVDNRVYFTVNVQRSQTDDKDEIVTETEIHTVPVGLVMNVTPQISEHDTVMLNVRPTLSRILGFVDDPNPELALANVRNGVPEIQVREMESMLQVNSGDVAIIGGLMQESYSDSDAGLPGLSRLPIVGRIFSSQSRERRQTELLIVLRPTVITDTPGFAGSIQ